MLYSRNTCGFSSLKSAKWFRQNIMAQAGNQSPVNMQCTKFIHHYLKERTFYSFLNVDFNSHPSQKVKFNLPSPTVCKYDRFNDHHILSQKLFLCGLNHGLPDENQQGKTARVFIMLAEILCQQGFHNLLTYSYNPHYIIKQIILIVTNYVI